MPIITTSPGFKTPAEQWLNLYPNQFLTDKEKSGDEFIKRNMDYFFIVAINHFAKNKRTVVPNYELVKGILRRSDFYMEPEVKSFTDTILQSDDLPGYVKHYSILTPPINTMVGEMTKRPDNVYVKAFDDDSKSEELEFKTQILQQYILDNAKQRLQGILAQQGTQIDSPDELEQMTQEKVKEYMTDYTSTAEMWGSRVLEAMKVRFSMKEKSEDAFRDLLISGKEFYHIYEDNSPFGFNVEVVNPKNVWWLTTPDEKYISDPMNPTIGAYAAGTIEILEISEIMRKYELTEEEVEHLRKLTQQAYLLSPNESNLVKPGVTGHNSVTYQTYDPLVLQTRLLMEAELKENNEELADFLGITNNVGVFGQKYMVVRAYWCSKKKIGKLTFINEQGEEEITLVDENYKNKSHPGQISLEWSWINQWYQGLKIGQDVYYVKPLEILDYCPVIGAVFENKNIDEPRSLVDLMKPFQVLYNIAMNQLFRLLEKEIGVVFVSSIRHIPVPKDGSYQDAIEIWEEEAREKGIVFVDDSPENTKGPSSFNQFARQDLSRTQEIESRYQLAVRMREECWKLVGLNEQRLGGVAATETATGTNTAITQSYAQTESWFATHEYVLNKLYQALLDVALYIESQKPVSTISNISTEGEKSFVQVNGSEIKLKELGVYVTSRAEDAKAFMQLESLSQAMLQNGASPYDVAVMQNTKSMRKILKTLKDAKDDMDAKFQQEQQTKQQELQQQQQQFQQQQQLQMQQHQAQVETENYNKELDRQSKEKIALIMASAKGGSEIIPGDENALEQTKFDLEREKSDRDYQMKMQKLQQEQQKLIHDQSINQQKLNLEKQKLEEEAKRTAAQLKIAKQKAQQKPKK